jgi:phage terminase large subunit-like protein
MHRDCWDALEGGHRFVSIEMFRGAAKTTLLRAFASKRIAYAESRTILYASESQDHAKRSVRWIRRQVLFNRPWANFFKLSLGTKKTDEWLEIYHGIDDEPISLVAIGITGQTRGVNLDDFRPDLIIVDDPCDEENTATPEQRKKINNLFYGLAKSLAPPVDSENALMCLLQTPLNEADLISSCRRDPQWFSLTFGCFNEDGQSRWPQRYPTQFLMADKKAHIARNDLALWLREMECKIVAEGLSAFRQSWLKPYPEGVTPLDLLAEGGQAFLWIDPVPPPSERELARGLKGKDWEVLAVVIKYKGEIYLAEYAAMRGHDPDWTVMKFWELVDRFRVFQFGVETVNYQRTLKWLLEQSMLQRGRFVQCYVPDKADKRKKSYRIIDALKGVSSQGRFHVIFEEHSEFVEQYTAYPAVNHDDVIEAVSEATRVALQSITFEGIYSYDDEAPTNEATLGSAP